MSHPPKPPPLPDPATPGQSRAAQLAARTAAWRGQAQDPQHRQARIAQWQAQ